jgi:hypothetical protein
MITEEERGIYMAWAYGGLSVHGVKRRLKHGNNTQTYVWLCNKGKAIITNQ